MSTNIEFEISPIEEADKAILSAVKEYFQKDLDAELVDPQIEVDISKYLSELREDLYCFIEYPYVDKVFRDSYYHYYSSKHYTYQRDCIRVSLFESKILPSEFLNPKKHKSLNKKYLGFFVVRPTTNALFGRSLINPKAFIEDNFKICKCKINSLVYGVKLETEGFPHSSQDSETIKCAETTIWGLMEYFACRYMEYKPALPAKIHRTLEKFSYQRQLPSDGLTMNQISYALKEFGFGTRIYSSGPYDKKINNIIDSYIESGIPVLTGLESDEAGHVLITIGKQYNKFKWKDVTESKFIARGSDVSYYDTTNIPAKYVVQDDNLQPYRLINLNNPGEHYDDDSSKGYFIDSIIVPLYQKIYLESVVAKELFLQIIKDTKVGYNFANKFVFRYFLASSRSFKNHISNLKDLDSGLKYSILSSRMPKFIWCAEIYTKTGFQSIEKEAVGLVILDATEANRIGIDALIFASYPDRSIRMNENNFVTLQYKLTKYSYFSNLK
jgi:hypothetical protein